MLEDEKKRGGEDFTASTKKKMKIEVEENLLEVEIFSTEKISTAEIEDLDKSTQKKQPEENISILNTSSERILCETCDEDVSTVYCPICDKNLCDDCYPTIHIKKLKEHETKFTKPKKKQKHIECNIHKIDCQSFCVTCSMFTCFHCVSMTGTHALHENKLITQIQGEIQVLNEREISNFEERLTKMNKSVQILETQKAIIQSSLKQMIKNHEDAIEEFKKDISEKENILLKWKSEPQDIDLFIQVREKNSSMNFVNENSKTIKKKLDKMSFNCVKKIKCDPFYGTNILSFTEQQILHVGLEKKKWKLIYRASTGNYKNSAFHEACDEKGTTVVIIKTKDGSIFGGYTPLLWNKIDGKKKDLETFLFCLKGLSFHKFSKKNMMSRSINCFQDTGIRFGVKDIVIDEQGTGSSEVENFTNQNEDLRLFDEYTTEDDISIRRNTFKVEEYEVYLRQ
eukprot:gene5311-8929_t